MSNGTFEERHVAEWRELDFLIESVENRKPAPGVTQLPRRFRQACADLAIARHRMYPGQLTDRLNTLVIRGYKLLYVTRRGTWESVAHFAIRDFPRAVRREARLFWLCSALFWLPFFGMLATAWLNIDWIQAILGADGMKQMEAMYGGREQQISHLREEYGANFAMFGHYIRNNIGIDFSIFAGGILACLGTIFFLIYNGIFIGAAAGYVQYACNPESFWTFVSGHSSFELLGMIVAGMAGFRLGLGVLRPGRLPRSRAIAAAAKQALPLIYGAGIMTALAACVEGFWSARDFEPHVKYTFGAIGWTAHILYFMLMGRGESRAA